ncbi:DUF3566 domain-containing protein [Cellulomonas sp. Marseille-Q8402]
MSSDTPPSIPPRKTSGGDSDKPAGGRTATDTAGRGTTPKASGGSGSPATKATPAAKGKPAPRTGSSGSGGSGSTASSAPATAAAGTAAATSTAPKAATGASSSATATQEAARPASGTTPRTGTSGSGSAPATSARPAASSLTSGTGPRRVRLAVSRVDPWSVMKLSFLISVAIGIMIVVATAVVWLTLDSLQVFATINGLVTEVLADSDFDIMRYVEFDRVLSVATLVGVVDIFLVTALATIGAFLYNITAALVGGVHVTMTDE